MRIRVGFKEGACLETIQPWTPLPAGRQQVAWDGNCQRGIFRGLLAHPDLQFTAVAMSLPVNVLVATNSGSMENASTVSISLPADWAVDLPVWAVEAAGQTVRVEPDFGLDLQVEADSTDELMKVKVNCLPEDRSRLLNNRFEIILYVDSTYFVEEEQGLLPQTFEISARGLAPGRHVITINIVNRDGELGTISREFIIPERRDIP